MYSQDECFRMMDLPDYYGGPRLYQTDYTRPYTPPPPARRVTSQQRAEMGRRIEKWKQELRARWPEIEAEAKAAAYRRAECVRAANADEVIGDVISVLESFDGGQCDHSETSAGPEDDGGSSAGRTGSE